MPVKCRVEIKKAILKMVEIFKVANVFEISMESESIKDVERLKHMVSTANEMKTQKEPIEKERPIIKKRICLRRAKVVEDTSRDATKGNIKDVLNDAKNVDVDVAKKDVVDSVEGGVSGMVKDNATLGCEWAGQLCIASTVIKSKIRELKQTIAKLEKKNSSLTVEQDRIANALLAKKF
ncbi:hypothetical protein EV1_009552 [Malus domestica]